jgi:PncC family amidohydrolase
MYDSNVIGQIKEILIQKEQTIAVAESVTAGHLQAALSSAENASQFFQGGITAYNLGQKSRHLNIEPILAERCNSVSDKIAEQMAVNVAHLFSSDWGIAITGYAAPVPECSIEELFAYYSICYHDQLLETKKLAAKKDDAMKVQIFYVNKILTDFHRIVGEFDQSSVSRSDRNSINSKLASAGPLSTSPSME